MAQYCPECRKIRAREASRVRDKFGPLRKKGSIDICKECGNEYAVEFPSQRYCPECREKQKKQKKRLTIKVGQTYNSWQVVSRDVERRSPKFRVMCTECGYECVRTGQDILGRGCPNCAKTAKAFRDEEDLLGYVGQTFGELTRHYT